MKTFEEWLDHILVYHPGMLDGDWIPEGWYVVVDGDSPCACFEHEVDAYRFRLDLINLALNARKVP